MSLFKMKRGQESKVSSLAKEDGSLIFSFDGANDSTVRLDQNVNGTVQRLDIAVDKAKNADALGGSSLSQVLASAGGGNAFTGLDTTTNNKIKLTRANGGTVEKTINNVSNASTASYASTAILAGYPQGFQSRTTSATWGNTTGSFITGWYTSSGGDVAFMNDNPSSGKVSMKLDGYFYQNEGANRVLDTSDAANYVKKSGDTMTGALNFANSTWNTVGGDVKIGDHDIAGSLGVMGANGQTRIDWCKQGDASKYQGIVYDGTKLATSGTFKADYFEGVAKDSQALAGSTLAQIIEAAGGVVTIVKNLKPTIDWMDTGIAGTALSTGTYIVQVSGLQNANTPGIYGEIWSGVFSWYSGGTNSTNSDEILLHNAGHADNSNELYLRTVRQGSTSGGVMKLQMAVKQASTSTVDVTFKFRKMI